MKRKLKEKRDFEEKTVHKNIRYISLLGFQMKSNFTRHLIDIQNKIVIEVNKITSIDNYKSTNYLHCKPCCYFVIKRIV